MGEMKDSPVTQAQLEDLRRCTEVIGDRFTCFDWHGLTFDDETLLAKILSEKVGRQVVIIDEHHAGNGHLSGRIIDKPGNP